MALPVRADITAKRLGESRVVVDVATNTIFDFNESGIRIWERLAADKTIEQAAQFTAAFDIALPAAITAIEDLRGALRENGLLKI